MTKISNGSNTEQNSDPTSQGKVLISQKVLGEWSSNFRFLHSKLQGTIGAKMKKI